MAPTPDSGARTRSGGVLMHMFVRLPPPQLANGLDFEWYGQPSPISDINDEDDVWGLVRCSATTPTAFPTAALCP